MKSKINLQETFKQLDDILKKLESSNLDIDKMVKLYEEGMRLTKDCKTKIKEAEQRIKIITDDDELIEGCDL